MEEDEQRTNKKARTDSETATAVSTSVAIPERARLRKDPRQHLWEREAQSFPPPRLVLATPPSGNPENYEYIPALDPAVMSQLGQPMYRQANPHFRMSRAGPMPPQPLLPHRPFPEGPFQVPPIMASEFKGNISEEMLEELQAMKEGENAPTILAFIPHGAGKIMAAPPNATQIATDSQEFIRSLAFEENDRKAYDVLVHPPDIRNAGGERSRPFAKPWTFFIEIPHNATPLLRFLLWQRVFAVSKTVSFTVYDLDNDDRYWDIYPIMGTSVLKNASHAKVLSQKEMILTAIKRDLSVDRDFRVYASELAFRNLRHTGDLTGAITTLCSTFHLERTELEDPDGEMRPAYMLLARPPVASDLEDDAWRALFNRHPVYRISLQRFTVALGAHRVFCELCKSRIHCTARCPWPNTEGWLGITPRDLGVRASNATPPVYHGRPGEIVSSNLFQAFQKACQEAAATAAAAKAALNQKGMSRQAPYTQPKASRGTPRKGKGKGRAH
ncbi:hypothetical protein BN946_scf184814.g5 [Trametes cinnabarina]|uniref:Uncharacterized protein n=1 Tax=Pycnoporus cinnabarinus TaxID=5643 RepID=A0A060SNF7_PYCCI|nr:hypothetical protein BN946_scf184814.g5 [Trametes cinnabarina]